MSILRITKLGEPILKKVCAPVDYDAIRPGLPKLLRDMWATLYSAKGVGLAAPQIGLNVRLSVVDVRPQGKSQRLVLINPEIIARAGAVCEEEGCLSLPGVYAKINRYARVRLRALDERGRPYELDADGLLAKAFQHEVDHLDGRLFIDHLEFVEKLKIMSLIKEVRKNWS
ncbi:MAG TPA: peptide deformylase [Elusimicrobia bacterium]|nr:peptide deformylase [Elusimicrobiota bacterium]HBT60247.1 peptide deformylase [Elusimicrobiota bacterium]